MKSATAPGHAGTKTGTKCRFDGSGRNGRLRIVDLPGESPILRTFPHVSSACPKPGRPSPPGGETGASSGRKLRSANGARGIRGEAARAVSAVRRGAVFGFTHAWGSPRKEQVDYR